MAESKGLKDTKVTVLVEKDDLTKLQELAAADDVSHAHVIRTLIRGAHDQRFGRSKKK